MAHLPSRMDLLSTKLHPPPVREKRVVRARLLEKLDASLNKKITLICAPAGYGKTTLLSQWSKYRNEPVGWITLDDNDNDLVQFLSYFLAAIQCIDPAVGALIPEMLGPPQPLPGSKIWIALINDLADSEKEFVLILDDYHEVEAQPVHEAFEYFIEHMPGNLHLILASRADPPLSLARLRARGHLIELRQSDLRFTPEDSADFLNDAMSLNLSTEDVIALETRTEGWIAALQMAALSLQEHSRDPTTQSAFIQSFTGSHRFVIDYLVEEVLERQPPAIQEFLLKTSILKQLNGSLCNAVTDRSDGQDILEKLDAANLFIIPLDEERSWYRYHRLFSDLLIKHLLKTSPELLPDLHRRASSWNEKQGLMNEAIDHALSAHDFERAAGLIEESVEATLMRSQVMNFLNWMERLPDEYGRNRARLSFFHNWALLMSGQSQEVVERRLQSMVSNQDAAESSGVMVGRIAALRAYLSLFQADIYGATKLCHLALEHLPEGDLFLRSIITWILSMIRLSDGELQDGKQTLDQAIKMSQEIGNPFIAVAALSHQAKLQIRQGHLRVAQETLEQALQLATDPQGKRLPIASEALIVLGDLEREWNHLEKAADYLTESIELAKQWSELASFDAYFPLMRLRLAQGDMAAAREALEISCQIAQRSDFSQVDDILVDLQRAYFFIWQGNVSEALRWVEKCGVLPGVVGETQSASDERQRYIQAHLRKYKQLVLARAFILQEQTTEALALLQTLLDQARQLDRTDLAIEIHILSALAYQQAGKDDQASEAFAEALSLAEPGGYVRIFLDEGEPMVRLLHQLVLRGVASAYESKLLAATGELVARERETKPSSSHALPLIEPLSGRELEVLRLLAIGMSNPEIADELVIAVSTVHSHCKSIYSKLGVHTRWDARQRAQELGLI